MHALLSFRSEWNVEINQHCFDFSFCEMKTLPQEMIPVAEVQTLRKSGSFAGDRCLVPKSNDYQKIQVLKIPIRMVMSKQEDTSQKVVGLISGGSNGFLF